MCLLTVAFALVFPVTVMSDGDREAREVRFAEDSLLWGLIASQSQEGLAACQTESVSCCPERTDLALMVLANKRSPAALAALAALVRFQLDGAVAEDFDCYLLAKGKPLLKHLRAVKPAELAARCEREVKEKKAAMKDRIADVQPSGVCEGKQRIEARIKEISSAISAGRRCDEGF